MNTITGKIQMDKTGKNEKEMLQPEYKTKYIQATIMDQQLKDVTGLLDDFSTPRYVIGTALFDILRHPLHPVKPVKTIVGCVSNKIGERRAAASQGKKNKHEKNTQENRDKALAFRREKARAKGKRIWVLKCPAPRAEKVTWGDYHFCVSLRAALKKQGQYVEIHMYEDWDSPVEADVVLVLRGLHKYRPAPGSKAIYIMWNISHPELVSDKEYGWYDIVYVASRYYAGILQKRLSVPVYPLLQCTDTTRFYETDTEKLQSRNGLLFIGNARYDGRPCVNWAAASGYPLRIYGKGWKKYLRNWEECVVGESINNKDIRAEYVKAMATLNDHWASMQGYQFVNNRVFDALACGLPIVSDRFEELYELFPEEILYYTDRISFSRCLMQLLNDYDAIKEKAESARERIINEFSFDARAKTLIGHIESFHETTIHKDDVLKGDLQEQDIPKKGLEKEIFEKAVEQEPSQNSAEIDLNTDYWDIVFLWKQNDTGIFGRRHDMLMKYFAEDPRIRKIIEFDRPIDRDLLTTYEEAEHLMPFSREGYIVERANRKEYGLRISDKIIQYNYIVPPHTPYHETDYTSYIKNVLDKEGIGQEKTLLWICPIVYEADLFMDLIDADLIAADFIDDEREFLKNPEQKMRVTDHYRSILAKSDYAFCNCEKVYQNLLSMCPWKADKISVVPNAVECTESLPLSFPVPDRLQGIPHPILGYAGNFSSKFDVKLMEYLSSRHPDWQFVLIGSAHIDNRIDALKKKPNIHLLNVVPYNELAEYIQYFDVAIMPHVTDAQSTAMNPLKLFVYAMYRKPIVCTKVPNIDQVGPLACVADDYRQFEEYIENILENGYSIDEKAYELFMKKENWRNRKEDIFRILFSHT